ncbi:MAG TPA: protein kinase [Polyangiaceae bacterium]|nr:protein kinase [Polyangiaceae bacterium]
MIDIGSAVNGKYRLVRLLGDGGMGSVYEAQHLVLGTRVAIKVLHPELARRTGLVERFLQEARVAAQIRSPHVVQVSDVDRTPDGHAYIVMELLEGEALSAVLDRLRKLPVTTACEYTLQILAALEAAHALGVIHRDLKPENVFVTFAGGRPVLKLIDFGIAKARRTDPQQRNLTVAGVVMGTAEYMAPEQARSADKVDARADLYAVGVMLYEMVAGTRPVSGEDARVIALKVERGEVVPLVKVAPEVPRELAGLVHRAMAARPELRFASATEMRLALERVMAKPQAQPQPAQAPVPEMTATGTLKNVPANQVLGGASPSQGRQATAPVAAMPGVPAQTPPGTDPSEPAVHTERAPPIATALAPPVYAAMGPAMPMPGVPYAQETERRSRAPVVALVALSLLLGAGVVAMLIATGTLSLSSNDTPPQPLPGGGTSTPTILTTSTPSPGAPTGTGSPVPTLSPTVPGPPGPAPHPTPSNRPGPAPAPAADAGGYTPPFVFPSNLPPFPSVLPPFPTTIPSIFPSMLPPWPVPPPTAPPSPAPTHSGGSNI